MTVNGLPIPRWFPIVLGFMVTLVSAGVAAGLKLGGLAAVRSDLDAHVAWADQRNKEIGDKLDALVALECIRSPVILIRAARLPCADVLPPDVLKEVLK